MNQRRANEVNVNINIREAKRGQTMTGNMVEFEAAGSNGRTTTGYLAVPASGRGPGVLVLHAWWGLNEFFKSLCERLAGEGFVALAPDLYHGRTAASIDGAKQLMSTLNSDEASLDITGAIDYLLAQQATQGDKVGVIGFSMGGAWALQLDQHVAAIVTFYGLGDPQDVTANAAFLGHFADPDEFESIEDARQLEELIRASGREVTFHIYSGAQHWFFEEDRPDAYNPEAAQLAWERTLAFLHTHLPHP